MFGKSSEIFVRPGKESNARRSDAPRNLVKLVASLLAHDLRRATISKAKGDLTTKMCMLPFSTPCQEPDGSIRLCSASSTFGYADETNMDNTSESGLLAVWTGEKYQSIRETLLTSENLKPYCAACEYRHSGPVWLFQLHVALHAYHNGIRDEAVNELILLWSDRKDEYLRTAPALGLPVYPIPKLPQPAKRLSAKTRVPTALIQGTELPIYLDLNTLNRCNVSCVMCPPALRKDDLGEERDKYYRLTLDEFDRLTKDLNIKTAHFVGAYAEPLLNKDIFSLVELAHMRGAFTAITTNAMPLVPLFARKLVERKLDMLTISLHGATASTAEAIMRRSKFTRVIENIRCLQEIKLSVGTTKPEIYFNYVTQRANIEEIPAFVSLASELGVRHINIIHLIDGAAEVDKSSNPIHFPDILSPSLKEAQKRAHALGINLYISPAFAELAN